jgi:serine protease Do
MTAPVRVFSPLLVVLLVVPAAPAQYSRITPEVQALQNTKDAIVTLKVTPRGASGNVKPIYGTGVIIDGRGFVVTNAHVVAANAEATVILWDGTALTGTVHVTDPANDLALVKLPAGKAYKELRLATSSDVMLAERIIAVGNPFGYTKTVTTGTISGLDRTIHLEGARLEGMFQIDAPINPGNSGGPVLNINGELIALVVAVRDGAQGIAFAIPSDQVGKMLARHLGTRVARPEADERMQVAARAAESTTAPLKIAGRPVTNSFDVERALWNADPGPVRQVALDPTGR